MSAFKTLVWITVVLVHGSVTALVPSVLLHTGIRLPFGRLGAFRFLGLLPALAGILALLCSVWELTSAGEGTPAPFDPPKKHVARGLYRHARNPMYVGDLLVVVGEALVFESAALLLYALLVLGVCHLFVVLHEEPTLKRKFGERYERYCANVPRWVPAGRARRSVPRSP
jgi:protein-S-isoprenylcysteine O-methyltransferase Ste14